MRHMIDALRGAVAAAQQAERVVSAGPMNDEEVHTKLFGLEERVGISEGSWQSVKVGKSSVKMAGAVTNAGLGLSHFQFILIHRPSRFWDSFLNLFYNSLDTPPVLDIR
jgi:hypothetical protein